MKKKTKLDPVCLIHGKKMSEHYCLYCCLCFKSLIPEECNVRKDGKKEDVCKSCAKKEALKHFNQSNSQSNNSR